jgi:hypothetical protein
MGIWLAKAACIASNANGFVVGKVASVKSLSEE